MATRGRKPGTGKKQTDELLNAARFVKLTTEDENAHCIMREGWCVAFNGVMTAGARTTETLDARPHLGRLIAALERCGEGYTITQVAGDRLAVKSGPFRATIPCMPAEIPVMWADTNVAPLDDKFLAGLKAILHVADEHGSNFESRAILVSGKSMAATNRAVMVEYWHGNDLPPHFIMPKAAAVALIKSGKIPTGFGYSGNSCTFHFDDSSFFMTQLYEDKYPNIAAVFEKDTAGSQEPIPLKLFESIEVISPFSDLQQIKFEPDLLVALNGHGNGAEHDLKGLQAGATFAVANLKLLGPIAKTMSKSNGRCVFFAGENLRGAISVL